MPPQTSRISVSTARAVLEIEILTQYSYERCRGIRFRHTWASPSTKPATYRTEATMKNMNGGESQSRIRPGVSETTRHAGLLLPPSGHEISHFQGPAQSPLPSLRQE